VDNTELIKKFYQLFSNADAEGMVNCYHEEIQFEDPAFGILKGEDAKNMWRMLVERSKGQIKITFSDVVANEKTGSACWEAHYTFGQTERKVINKISAQFEFKEGKIVKHTDYFSMWKWSRQALGLSGFLLGWSSFMQKKIQQRSNLLLKSFPSGK
jgi:ketosteroid isomerase-like protein